MDKPITYYLEDKEKFQPLLNYFLDKSIKEQREKNGDGNFPTYADFYEKFVSGNSQRNTDYIYDNCESPIERIFLSSLMLAFIRNGFPCLHFTPPAKDVEENIKNTRETHLGIMRFIESYKTATGDTDLSNFQNALLKKKDEGKITDNDIEEINVHDNIIKHFVWNSYHFTPQAGFPRIKVNNRSIRADLLIWVPGDEKVKIIVECDGYTYHNSKESFQQDRARDRQLQLNGYRVLRYAGSDINKDPIGISNQLFDLLDVIDEDASNNL